MHIKFVQENDIELESQQGNLYEISLDVESKSIAPDNLDKIDENFAHALVNDLCEEDWGKLNEHYFLRKVLASEAADLTSVEAVFPVEDIENKSLLIFYKDIIPYSRPVIITVEEKSYFVDDIYCVKPDCHCNEAHLLFIPSDSSGKLDTSRKEEIYSVLDLKLHRWGVKEHEQATISGKAIMDTFLEEKGIVDLYKTRYETMRLLYIKYRNMNYLQSPVKALDKVGRNAPCPCGSGKKYKKCCL